MVKTYFLFISVFASFLFQDIDIWQVLSEVGFERKPGREAGYEIDSPKFSKRLLSYNGKRVIIKGYLVPLSEMSGRQDYMISALPFNQCYFCGGAGPETVVEVQSKETVRFVTRQIAMEGILVLNASDPDHHMYILKEARLVE
jgi:hypothetical protein